MTLRHVLGMRLGVFALLSAAFAVVLPNSAAFAADAAPRVTVSITHLSPATLPTAGTITLAGGVRNGDNHAWRNVIVHLVLPHSPFVDHSQARAAITGATDYTGPPLPGQNAMEEFGILRAGASEHFSITIRRSQLQVSGADGVYPIGVQVIADRPTGAAGRVTLSRATTFLPAWKSTSKPTRTVVLWPFLLPGTRRSDGSYADEAGLLKAVGPHGQLRNLLTLVRTTPKLGADALIDPALFAVLGNIAHRPANTDADRARRDVARSFLTDLTHLADGYSCASLGFDRPDWTAVLRAPAAKDLTEVIDRATVSTLSVRNIECTRVEWPSPRSVTRPLLNDLHAAGTSTVILSPRSLPNWQSTTGSLLGVQTPTGSLSVIMDDPLDAGMPGRHTLVGLRQTILSEAVFGSIAADTTKEPHPAIIVVDPHFDPGTVSGTPLAPALGTEVIDRKNLAATLRTTPARYAGTIPASSDAKSVSQAQLAEAADAAQTDSLLGPLLFNQTDRIDHAQLIAALTSQWWRRHRTAGLRAATAASKQLSQELADISVEGPRALTLSSRSGRFPITIRNHTPHAIQVGVDIESSATGVTFKAPTTVQVSAGESRTSTVTMNMDGQTGTTVSVRLTSADNASFGASTVFNVRSSRVGAALWIAIGISVAFVAIALARRFGRPGHEPSRSTLPPMDFDD